MVSKFIFCALFSIVLAQRQAQLPTHGVPATDDGDDGSWTEDKYETPASNDVGGRQFGGQPQYRPPQPQQYQAPAPQSQYRPQPQQYSQSGDSRNAAILTEARYLQGDGKFGASYTQDDGVEFKEESDADGTRRGSYSWVDPTGERRTVSYVAGKNGFQASGAHLPVAPAGPAAAAPAPQPQYQPQPQQYQSQPQYRPQSQPSNGLYDVQSNY